MYPSEKNPTVRPDQIQMNNKEAPNKSAALTATGLHQIGMSSSVNSSA
jgi:hypothetical protein